MRLVEAGWDSRGGPPPARAAHHRGGASGRRARAAALHLGPLLSDDDRRYLTCDATCEVWFERHGQVIGSGRATRTVNRRLRRALEHRDRCCVVPGCGATRGLHAHHIRHWEDGGPTELDNLVLVCPYHHRLHHRGVITITGPAHQPRRHRQRRPTTERGIPGPPTDHTPARGPTVPRAHRRTRRLVVVPTLPTTTTTNQIIRCNPTPDFRGEAIRTGAVVHRTSWRRIGGDHLAQHGTQSGATVFGRRLCELTSNLANRVTLSGLNC